MTKPRKIQTLVFIASLILFAGMLGSGVWTYFYYVAWPKERAELDDLIFQAGILGFHGHREKAEAMYREALEWAERIEEDDNAAQCCSSLGRLALESYQLEQARAWAERSLKYAEKRIAKDKDQIHTLAPYQVQLAYTSQLASRPEEARRLVHEALRSDPESVWLFYVEQCAGILNDAGEWAQAQELVSRRLKKLAGMKNWNIHRHIEYLRLQCQLARTAAGQEDFAGARQHLSLAEEKLTALPAGHPLKALVLLHEGLILELEEDFEPAREKRLEALETFNGAHPFFLKNTEDFGPRMSAVQVRAYARTLGLSRDLYRGFQLALDSHLKQHDEPCSEIARIHHCITNVLWTINAPELAAEHLSQCIAIYEKMPEADRPEDLDELREHHATLLEKAAAEKTSP